MSIIFQTNTCKILKQKKNYKLTYENGEKFKHFFTKIKKNINIDDDKNNTITFNALKVESLNKLLKRKKNLSYRHLKQLFTNIGKQFESLEKDGYTHLFLKLNDIVRVEVDNQQQKGGTGNDIFFLYLNTQHFLPIDKNFIEINRPFNKNNLFISPELNSLKSFPTTISVKSYYYSLALLVCYCGIIGDDASLTEYNNIRYDIEKIKIFISNIENTKLYWSLLRCLKHNPEERVYLYI